MRVYIIYKCFSWLIFSSCSIGWPCFSMACCVATYIAN